MYFELAKIFLSAVFFRATNIFGIKTAAVYLSLSLILLFAKPEANMPASFLLTTAFLFALYVATGIFKNMVKGKRTAEKTGAKDGIPGPLNMFLPIFSIGYVFSAFKMNMYLSIIAVFALYFALRKCHIPKTAWSAAFALSVVHAMIFTGIMSLLNPAIYAVAYLLLIRFFFAAKDVFSVACKPHELEEGMTPAEAIVWDGKKYVFTNSILPSMMGLVRYGMEQRVFGKRVVASFFSPIKKENLAEIQDVCKKYKKPVFFVQKKTRLMPFLIAGAVAVLFL